MKERAKNLQLLLLPQKALLWKRNIDIRPFLIEVALLFFIKKELDTGLSKLLSFNIENKKKWQMCL